MMGLFDWVANNFFWLGSGAFVSGAALFYLVMIRMLKHRNHPAFVDREE